jgi:hypothetical protein
MKLHADVFAADCWTFEDVVNKRTISRMLLDMLIDESNYRLATEMVAGFAPAFTAYKAKIDCSRRCHIPMTAECVKNLQSLLTTCRSELAYQTQWSKTVLARLPQGRKAAALRSAFAEVERAGFKLAETIESAEGQINAYTL